MSGATGLDIRLPIGGLFTVLGTMLAGYALATGNGAPPGALALRVNADLWWGIVMLVFGLAMLLASYRSARGQQGRVDLEPDTREADAIEERERRLRLEQ